MKQIAFLLIFLAAPVYAMDYSVVEERLAYLKDIEGVAQVAFERNNVFIGFESLPEDYETIVRAAAVHGNKALNRRVHVWACKYDAEIAPDRWPAYCFATAQDGKVVKFKSAR